MRWGKKERGKKKGGKIVYPCRARYLQVATSDEKKRCEKEIKKRYPLGIGVFGRKKKKRKKEVPALHRCLWQKKEKKKKEVPALHRCLWQKKGKKEKKRYPLCIGVFGYFHEEVKPGPHNL